MKKGGLGSRLIVAAWGIPLLLGLTWLGGWWTALLIAAISFVAQKEYYMLQRNLNRNPFIVLGLGCGVIVVITWMTDYNLIHWILIATFLIVAVKTLHKGKSHQDVLVTFGGICYIPLLLGSFIVIRGWSGGEPFWMVEGCVRQECLTYPDAGRWLAFCVLGSIWVGDTAAYAGGRMMGKHKLAPTISPNKTIEGFIFGFFGAILFSMIWWRLGLVRFDVGLVVGIAAGLFGQIGDLFESALKRECGVKDSSNLLPGHGGLLDRFDSLLFTAPIVAIYIIIFSVKV
ncbi:MAG: phosphatidate cytidylyltransferase [Candidatus Hatepunaea meridiana]|nr:phosphatidate cytidylyltransferase [Candidatus Hatepunaea meridiana]